MREHIAKLFLLLFSPTRTVIDYWKQGDSAHRGKILRLWNRWFFYLEAVLSVALVLITAQVPLNNFYLVDILPIVYAYSRINEIVYAFYNDPLSHAKESDLSAVERIRMAMRSYFGLAFNFALMYYFIPIVGLFKEPLRNFLEAFYFSGITLTTVGYGDMLPAHWLARILVLYEVFAGILLVAVAIASYIGGVKSNDNA